MGQNSTELAYGFGQFGSMLVDGTAAFYPPRGLVIVAITALDQATFHATNGLISELNKNNPGAISVSNYITTEGAGGHVDGEISDADPHNGNNATGTGGTTGVVTTAADMLAAGVKPGMYVHTTGTMLPYSLSNPFMVKAVTATTFTVTNKINASSSPSAANAAAVVCGAAKADGADEPCYFYSDFGQGVGGVEADANNAVPTGVTIYGRWTSGILTGGTVIAYFGK